MEPAMKEFHLLCEPWIRVMRPDASVEEVSLPDALIHAHEYLSLAGEMPTQDVAMLRLLLAVMHAVFSRVDADGNEAPLADEDDALNRWSELWQLGRIPESPIQEYLTRYEERFWLFHPERPFYQANAATIGTAYTPAKLNGELSESSNKVRLFSLRQGEAKKSLSYSEAARWLLHVNGFDDTSAKPKGKNLPSVGAGWLGKLGLIYAKGRTLFETLLLNFVLNNCEEHEPWESAIPIWELPAQRENERVEIPLLRDQAALLTLQSRRLLLEREKGRVTGYRLLGGDFFGREDAFVEQMTLWRPIYQKKEFVGHYQPMRHDPSVRLWREFAALTGEMENDNGGNKQHHAPGLVEWHSLLFVRDCFPDHQDVVSYQIASIQYGDKDFFVADAFADGVSFHLNLLSEVGSIWRGKVMAEIERCNRIAFYISMLATNLCKASGGSGNAEETDGLKAKEMFFYRVDVPFRRWLLTLDANQSDTERNRIERAWQEKVFQLARAIGQELAADAGAAAYSGRYVNESKEGSKEKEKIFYSTSKVLNWFMHQITKELKGRDEHADT